MGNVWNDSPKSLNYDCIFFSIILNELAIVNCFVCLVLDSAGVKREKLGSIPMSGRVIWVPLLVISQ